MSPPPTAREVFFALVTGVSEQRWDDLPRLFAENTNAAHPLDPLGEPAMRTHEDLRRRWKIVAALGPDLHFNPDSVIIHDTANPEVIVVEFEYDGIARTGERFTLPCIFVIRVRDGRIIDYRNYTDHFVLARTRGQLDQLVSDVKKRFAQG
jgi:uncharacterized protein